MIKYTKGDIFEAETEAIINTVNTVGVMGKGIALQFKQKFPQNFDIYKKACEKNELKVGKLLITESNSLFFKYIINFPTKKHWRNPSKYEYIEEGLINLIENIKKLNIKSIAIPPLGAGNGKLEWEKVKKILEKHIIQLPKVEFIIYEPQSAFDSRDKKQKTNAKLTPTRALLLDLFYNYEKGGDTLNLLVCQKLAYFLQGFGEPLRLNYTRGWYGPYAANLNKVLQAINGTYILYESQHDKPSTVIQLVKSSHKNIEKEYSRLSNDQKQKSLLLKKFIKGFETPFSLELLATVDWILKQYPNMTPIEIKQEINNWTKRKADLIKSFHIEVAYNHLMQYKNELN